MTSGSNGYNARNLRSRQAGKPSRPTKGRGSSRRRASVHHAWPQPSGHLWHPAFPASRPASRTAPVLLLPPVVPLLPVGADFLICIDWCLAVGAEMITYSIRCRRSEATHIDTIRIHIVPECAYEMAVLNRRFTGCYLGVSKDLPLQRVPAFDHLKG